MKNLLKKISAVAMAFTLLGTGTAISKNSPKPTNTLTAHAEFAHNCSSYKYISNIVDKVIYENNNPIYIGGQKVPHHIKITMRTYTYQCSVCGKFLYRETKTITEESYY